MSGPSTVIDNIGLLITNDAQFEVGATGQLRDAWVVLIDGFIEAVGTGQAPIADQRIDAAGRCVMPGSSTVTATWCSPVTVPTSSRPAWPAVPTRLVESARPSQPPARPPTTSSLTRAASLTDEANRSGTTTIEIKSGYGLTRGHEARCCASPTVTDETTFLGAHVVPPEYDGRVDDYVALVCGEMLAACAPHARWVDAFCERELRRRPVPCRARSRPGRGLGLRLHANQLGHGPGVQLAVELGCASADHCTYLSDDDVEALAASDTVATFLPATDFSTRQPYPDARRLLDAGVTVALASNCNPGSSYTTSMPFCIALAVRDMGMTIDEAIWAATAGGATALRRVDIGIVATGARADLIVLNTANPIEFVYRPGIPAVAATIIDGQTLWPAVDS